MKQKNNTRSNQNVKLWLAMPLIVSVAVALMSAYFAYRYIVQSNQIQRSHDITKLSAQQLADITEEYVEQVFTYLNQLSTSQQLASLALNPSEKLTAIVSARINSHIPELSAFRVIPKGSADLDEQPPVPIGYVELDMINQAEAGETVFPEATRTGNDWFLQFVVPVKTEKDDLVGTLLVSLQTNELAKKIEAGLQTKGAASLLQQYNRETAKKIVVTGQGSSTYQHIAETNINHWKIQFVASTNLLTQSRPALWRWLLVPFLGMLAGAIIYRPVKSWCLNKAIASSQHVLGDIVENTQAVDSSSASGKDIMDIKVAEQDKSILDLAHQQASDITEDEQSIAEVEVPDVIFRAYDIRGIVDKQLNSELMHNLGKAVGSEALDQGQAVLVVARDGRNTSDEYAAALTDGILSTGCNVIDIGAVPTPLMYFGTFELGGANSGVMVTASHNPSHFNGLKIVINQQALAGDQIQVIKKRVQQQKFYNGQGHKEERDISQDYVERISSDIILDEDLCVVVDAGNGIAGQLALQLFEELGPEVVPLYCDVDGDFPNHPADPSDEKNLQDLIAKVKESEADIGIALDGDGDRIGVVTPNGKILWADQLTMLLAKDVLTRNPGADIVYDVKSSRHLNEIVSQYGGRPTMWKTGHSYMKAKMEEIGALLGGELSGHIFVKDRWYGFDDGLYVAARLLEIMTIRDQDLDSMSEALPEYKASPEYRIPVSEDLKFEIVEKLTTCEGLQKGTMNTIDGVRVDFAKGWGLIRASNTDAAITMRFEADTDVILEQVRDLFKAELLKLVPDLELPF